MKLRNRKTGEIVEFRYLQSDHVAPLVLTTYENDKPEMYSYTSLAELNAEWCDVEEEPKEHWHIRDGEVYRSEIGPCIKTEKRKEIGNYFETEEEAEKAAEKLKAWKRLKDKGFRFNNWDLDADDEDVNVLLSSDSYKGNKVYDFANDLDLLFGGEE